MAAAVTEELATQVYRDPDDVNGMAATELTTYVINAELATVFTGKCHQYVGSTDT
ncbi:hypothetical protein [Actinomadura soli]|uniref:hypothetical protein n=1 Tax=Actinomadura soli TaxID=2508997 RepID=UPI0014868B9B|nr:hypothetical protein [Actinomadura soli]